MRILYAPTNRITDLKQLIPAVLEALDRIADGQVVRVHQKSLNPL